MLSYIFSIASSYRKEDSQVAMTVVGNGAYHKKEKSNIYNRHEKKIVKKQINKFLFKQIVFSCHKCIISFISLSLVSVKTRKIFHDRRKKNYHHHRHLHSLFLYQKKNSCEVKLTWILIASLHIFHVLSRLSLVTYTTHTQQAMSPTNSNDFHSFWW